MVRGELYESGQKLMLLKRAPAAEPCGFLWKPQQYDSSFKYNLFSMTKKRCLLNHQCSQTPPLRSSM